MQLGVSSVFSCFVTTFISRFFLCIGKRKEQGNAFDMRAVFVADWVMVVSSQIENGSVENRESSRRTKQKHETKQNIDLVEAIPRHLPLHMPVTQEAVLLHWLTLMRAG